MIVTALGVVLFALAGAVLVYFGVMTWWAVAFGIGVYLGLQWWGR